jgi:hypothetical protein
MRRIDSSALSGVDRLPLNDAISSSKNEITFVARINHIAGIHKASSVNTQF